MTLLSHKIAYPAQFEALWQAYPKRKGPNPKSGAYKAYRAATKTITGEQLTKAATDYAATVEANTPFIPMLQTWLNQGRYLDNLENDRVEIAEAPTRDWDWAAKFYKKHGKWPSISYGPEPGYAGCGCPREILSAYGLVNALEGKP